MSLTQTESLLSSKEELIKSQVAKASYEAWKEKKRETINMKVKEKLEALRKQESEMNEKEEKKETAKKVNYTQKIQY